MNDTTRKFLNAILERVPEDRVIEVRLFPAIRQGGVESGVAVLAVEPEPLAPVTDEAAGHDVNPDAVTEEIAAIPADVAHSLDSEVEVPLAEPADAVPVEDEATLEAPAMDLGVIPIASVVARADVANRVFEALERESALPVVAEGVVADVASAPRAEVEVPVELAAATVPADAASGETVESIALGDILALPSPAPVAEEAAAPAPRRRLAILCARYRLVFKGPDRGKWDIEVVHQADAPLDTLDRVISGVVRRSGEASEPERFTRERLRESLDAPAWAQSA